MATTNSIPALQQIARPVNLIPVGLKEAGLDSPTFRATAVHFSDQIELVEKWLDSYVKATIKLLSEVGALEDLVNAVVVRSIPPVALSEAVFDHDYTLVASRRAAEGAREFWGATIFALRSSEKKTVEPIKAFLNGELRIFKEARRYLDLTQRNYDSSLTRYASQSKTKEPSSLREDAFQLHEARRAYLRASMEFGVLAPQLHSNLDRLLISTFTDQWEGTRNALDLLSSSYGKWDQEMKRIQAWNRELGAGEKVFRKELQGARREIEEDVELKSRPSRELDDYAASTVPFLGSRSPNLSTSGSIAPEPFEAEKQGWLFVKTMSGKPARPAWLRRWFYVQNGIFGWMNQGGRSGGVEESDKTGVFLCNVKPAFQEDRRFCFEVKTKDSTMLLQAETQTELAQWITVFDAAKKKAFESASSAPPTPGHEDAAFAINPPAAPEFAAKSLETQGGSRLPAFGEDPSSLTPDRASTLPVPDREGTFGRTSFDSRRPTFGEGEGAREHASRIMQKLDIHRKSTSAAPPSPALGTGGIASLISASHTILPVHSTPSTSQGGSVTLAAASEMSLQSQAPSGPTIGRPDLQPSTLAPSTLANPPAATNMSKTAVIIGGERGIVSGSDVPSGMMANLWGTHNWAYVNRLESAKNAAASEQTLFPDDDKNIPLLATTGLPNTQDQPIAGATDQTTTSELTKQNMPAQLHRKTQSLDRGGNVTAQFITSIEDYPNNYPLALRTQDAQFRMLFPEVPREDKLVLVFRATWNPDGRQEFPGRVYITSSALFFYSHHMGLVLVSSINLGSIAEVKATPGDDADVLIINLKDGVSKVGFTRILFKVFLEPLKLLQRRLNLLVKEFDTETPLSLEDLIDTLIKLETVDQNKSPSLESWEDVSINTPLEGGPLLGLVAENARYGRDLRAAVHVDKNLHGHSSHHQRDATKFRLPAQPVVYEPQGMTRQSVDQDFQISPKALFHIMFGDKSAIFQALYHQRRAKHIRHGPWHSIDDGKMKRDFNYEIDQKTMFSGSRKTEIIDHQTILRMDDHLCYVIEEEKTGWHLPHQEYFTLVSQVIITYVTKSKCLLRIYTTVKWSEQPTIAKAMVEKQALGDMDIDAQDLLDLVSQQVRRLGPHVSTRSAVAIFGHVGQHKDFPLFPDAGFSNLPTDTKRLIKQRTLTNMMLEAVGSVTETAVSSLMIWGFSALRSIYRLCTANGIILSLLLGSCLVNMFFSYRDTFAWWNERKAYHFMSRLGVKPNLMMSRAVYLEDIHSVVKNNSVASVLASNQCYDTFNGLVQLTDLNELTAGTSKLTSASRVVARRLRLSRQAIGVQRHNLLVAMRMVNRLEKDVVQAEWENWLLDENAQCEKVGWMLLANKSEKRNGTMTMEPLESIDSEQDLLKDWYEGYCSSCRAVLDSINVDGSVF